MSKRISVVIPCGGNFPERVRNLHLSLECLRKQTFNDFELLLVEQTVDGSFYHSNLDCDKYIQLRDPLMRGFNRSWCRNVGANTATGDIILLMDGDYVFAEKYLEIIARTTDRFFSGTDQYRWSTLPLVEEYLASKDVSVFRKAKIKYVPFRRGIANGGIVGFDREWFKSSFIGYNENFFKYGYEDTEAVHRILRILDKRPEQLFTAPVSVAHLYHGVRDEKEGSNRSLFEKFTSFQLDKYLQALKQAGLGDSREPRLLPESL